MRELLRDPDRMTKIVRRRVLRAMVPALGKLDRVARGYEPFDDDHQRVACVALARLAGTVLGVREDPAEPERFGPEWHTPERILMVNRLLWTRSLTPEERQRYDEQKAALHEEWRNSLPDYRSMSAAENIEWHRTHNVKSIVEIDEEIDEKCYPPHLRKATLKGANHE